MQSFTNLNFAFFNLVLFSENGDLDVNEIKMDVVLKPLPLIDYYYEFPLKINQNKYFIRYCELEINKTVWNDINQFKHNEKYSSISDVIKNKILEIFSGLFILEKLIYCDVGYFIFKIILKASKIGEIYTDRIGTSIIVKDCPVENEIKKNSLLYENCNKLELRLGDCLIFYISHDK